MKTWKCSVGLHNWQLQKVLEYRMSYTSMTMDGYVCQTCGKHRDNPVEMIRKLPDPAHWTIVTEILAKHKE